MSDNGYPVSQATVTRQTLTSQIPVDGTLGYAGSYTVVNQAQGIYTSLPGAGQVVRDGQVLYQVGGNPVILLYGSVPAYRSLNLTDVTRCVCTGQQQNLGPLYRLPYR